MLTVSIYYLDLLTVFRTITDIEDSRDNDSVIKSVGYERWLSKTSTCFIITIYEEIFNQTDALFRTLQTKVMDIGFCCDQIRQTIDYVKHRREEFDGFYERFEHKCALLELAENFSPQNTCSLKNNRKRLFYNILDDIIVQLQSRFGSFSDLDFAGLVNCSNFFQMSCEFDDKKLQSLLQTYAKFFSSVKLNADLSRLYSSQTVRNVCSNPSQLLSFLHRNDLIQTVPEATKLLKLVLTLPATAASVERSFSALEKIKTYSRNRTKEERLSSLALIAIEMERLQILRQNKDEFYCNVIDAFVKNDRRMDFVYK